MCYSFKSKTKNYCENGHRVIKVSKPQGIFDNNEWDTFSKLKSLCNSKP